MPMIEPIINNRYRIEEEVGSGGMADVYKAYDLSEKRFVAFKVIKSEYCINQSYVKRFEKEADTALNLECKNIARAYDYGAFIDEKGVSRNYIALEFVDGCSLKDSLKAHGAVSPKVAVNITSSILDALECVHNAGYIHRDVKPQNVLISVNKNVKLTDFGIAKEVNADTKTYDSRDVLGSVHYISPEQASGDLVTAASDIYSAGILLYEMLVGKPPFDGDNPVQIALQHVTGTIIPPMDIDPKIPPSLSDVVMKATAKSPSDRYASAKEMKLDLQKAILHPNRRLIDFHESIDADARIRKRRRTKLWHIIVPVVLAVVLVIGASLSWYFVSRRAEADNSLARVPELYGKTIEQAEQLLASRGLEMHVSGYAYSDEFSADLVCNQEPVPGTTQNKGSEVSIVISQGSDAVVMIDLTGLTLEEAKEKLGGIGITISGITYVVSDEKHDTIIHQSIAAGSDAVRGDEIDVEISSASADH